MSSNRRIDLEYSAIFGTEKVYPYVPKMSWVAANSSSELRFHVQRFIVPASQSSDLSLPIIDLSNVLWTMVVNPDKLTKAGGATGSIKVEGDTASTEQIPVAPRVVFSGDVTALSAQNSSSTLSIELLVIKAVQVGTVTVPNRSLLLPIAWTDLSDTPSSYVDKAGFQPFVKADETGIELLPAGSKYVTKTITNANSPYTLTSDDHMVFADATSGPITVVTPAAASYTDQSWIVKKTDSSSNAVTLDGNSSETIDGQATISFILGGYEIISDGTNWEIIRAI